MDDFLLRALLAGFLISLISAPLGCFVVWRRMSYYGASIAHGGLLGVAIGLLLGFNLSVGVLLIAFLLTWLLYFLELKNRLPVDTLLGIIAHVALAAGVIAASMTGANIDLMSYLFGDILMVTWGDIGIIALLAVFGLVQLYRNKDGLLLFCLQKDMAEAEGVNTRKMHFLLLLLLAFTIAIAMKIVGILLITAMLIIPAATARKFAREPEDMVLYAVLISVSSLVAGFGASYWLDTQTGPSIILVMAVLFGASLLFADQS